MDTTRAMPKYKEFKIEWQSGVFDLQIKEKLEITLDEVFINLLMKLSFLYDIIKNNVEKRFLYESRSFF